MMKTPEEIYKLLEEMTFEFISMVNGDNWQKEFQCNTMDAYLALALQMETFNKKGKQLSYATKNQSITQFCDFLWRGTPKL